MSARDKLAAQQRALVTALLTGNELPPGFDTARLCAAVNALAQKRARCVARAWPALAQALGVRFSELFTMFAESTRLTSVDNSLADGRAFASWLSARQELPEIGQIEALRFDLHYVHRGGNFVLRRFPTLRCVRLHHARRWVIAVWMPWLGAHCFSIPFTPIAITPL